MVVFHASALGNSQLLDKRKLQIALVAPLYESIPPQLYGGSERVVYNLAEELTRRGHAVTLYASGDSHISGKLVGVSERALRLAHCVDSIAYHVVQNEWVLRDAEQFDVIHFHNGYLHFSLARRCPTPALTTLHGRLDQADFAPVAQEFADLPVVSISRSQRAPHPGLTWIGNVYNGIAPATLTFSDAPDSSEDYLVFLGRISPEKGPDRAIEIARRAKRRLKIAAKVDAADQAYFEREIKTLLSDPLVEFIGEVDEAGKNRLLRGARALLFPINWPEPFGLVMIEALACGTPVIAFPGGAVGEVMRDGVTGFVVPDVENAVAALQRVNEIKRRDCREHFERQFTSQRMADGYLRLYDRLIAGKLADEPDPTEVP